MNAPDDDDPYTSHERVVALLPWYVNGTLAGTERAAVERHLAVCLRCRADLRAERRVASAMRDVDVDMLAARNAFAALEQRLRAPPRRPPWRRLVPRAWRAQRAPTAAVLLAALTLALLPRAATPPAGAPFRTLATPTGTAQPAGVQLRVVFATGLDTTARDALLARHAAVIVAGPSAGDVYTLAPAQPDQADALLAALRATPAVRFAEPLAGAAAAE